MKNVILVVIVLLFSACSHKDPARGDASENFTGTYKFAIASPNGFISKYTWVITRRSVNMLDFDMMKTIVRGNGSETTSRDSAMEIEVTDERRLQFSYLSTTGRHEQVTLLAAPKKLTINSSALQGEDATHVAWYEFDKQ